MDGEIRYGVIGTGMMGIEHITNLLHLPGARVTAVADPHEQSRAWAQLAVGLDTPLATFESHHELLASGLCDAVVIAWGAASESDAANIYACEGILGEREVAVYCASLLV